MNLNSGKQGKEILLSVIIVSYRGWNRLEKCLDSLNNLKGRDFDSEVIIVDNTPLKDEIDPIRRKFRDFRFIHNDLNGGFGNGSNTGAKNASGKYLLFLNPDTVITGEAVSGLLRMAEANPSYTLLSCRQVNEKGKECNVTGEFPRFRNLTGTMRTIFGKKLPVTDISGNVVFPEWISGSVLLMRAEDFRKTGGFDEDFWMYYEDVDLCKRISDNGGTNALCRNLFIEHNHGGSSRINLSTTALTKTEVLISRHIYISKHIKGSGRFLIQLFMIVNNFISGFIQAVLGLIFFFIPKLFLRTRMFLKLTAYYTGALSRFSWISPRSVNAIKSGK
jgi:GT2 family glycosyltransferase